MLKTERLVIGSGVGKLCADKMAVDTILRTNLMWSTV